jgi:hypothetical protein
MTYPLNQANNDEKKPAMVSGACRASSRVDVVKARRSAAPDDVTGLPGRRRIPSAWLCPVHPLLPLNIQIQGNMSPAETSMAFISVGIAFLRSIFTP